MSPTTDPDVTAWNGEANIAYSINGIQGDMGEETIMDLIWQADGDIIVVLSHPRRGSLSIEFCTSFGGGRNPDLTSKLRDVVKLLIEQNKNKKRRPPVR